MNNVYNEERCIAQAAAGDSDSFGELLRHYEAFIYNVIFQIVGNRDDALDVSQETFFKAYKSLRNFRGECKFSTWLYRIAVNSSKDHLRSCSKRRVNSLTDYGSDDDDEGKTSDIADEEPQRQPEEALESDARRAAVREAIKNLSEDHRNVIIMRDIEGYSYEAISEMLGVEIGTVKSRLNRARLAVKDYLLKNNAL